MTTTTIPVYHIYRWDLDKTYLRSEFATLKDLWRTARQRPEDKVNVPGVVALIKALTRPQESGRAMITFISGSPSQMREKLERKFEIDGIRPDVFILKPTLQNILKGRFRAIRGQVGYKLETLLRIRAQAPPAPETLFGDDAEQDAFIYSLYADLAAGKIDEQGLMAILNEAQVYEQTQEKIRHHYKTMRIDGNVQRIFIHLEQHTAPGRFWVYGPRVVPIGNYFQAALVLYQDGVLEAESIVDVVATMIDQDSYGLIQFANSFQDLIRRRHLASHTIERLARDLPNLKNYTELPPQFLERLLVRVRALAPRSADSATQWNGPPDYVAVLRADKKLRDAVKEASKKPTSLFF